MIFSSLEFIFIFLPIFLISYFISPVRYKNYVILIGSIIFYLIGSWGHPYYVVLLIVDILFNYKIGQKIGKNKNRTTLIFGIIYNLFWLVLFKLKLLLAIGISFYTFQSISYLVDVYIGKNEAEKSLIKYATQSRKVSLKSFYSVTA